MKKYFCILVCVTFLAALCSCTPKSPGRKEEDEAVRSDGYSAVITQEKLIIDIDRSVYPPEHWTFSKYLFTGVPFYGEGFDIASAFDGMVAADAVCHMNVGELKLRIEGEAPSAIRWGEVFYRASDAEFPARIVKLDLAAVENGETVLALAPSPAGLSSEVSPAPLYRIVRIIAEYGSRSVEYYAVFDGFVCND